MQVTLFAIIYYFTIIYYMADPTIIKDENHTFLKKISEWPRSVLVSQFSSVVRAPIHPNKTWSSRVESTGDFHTSHMMNIRLIKQ